MEGLQTHELVDGQTEDQIVSFFLPPTHSLTVCSPLVLIAFLNIRPLTPKTLRGGGVGFSKQLWGARILFDFFPTPHRTTWGALAGARARAFCQIDLSSHPAVSLLAARLAARDPI